MSPAPEVWPLSGKLTHTVNGVASGQNQEQVWAALWYPGPKRHINDSNNHCNARYSGTAGSFYKNGGSAVTYICRHQNPLSWPNNHINDTFLFNKDRPRKD